MSERKATNITWHAGEISPETRAANMGQRGATLWFTGLSGSGKSTVAVALEQKLIELGRHAYRLDGDNVRHGLNANLGFSAEDRTENIRRVGEVSKLFTDAGMITITSFISPFRTGREAVRKLHEEAGLTFIEVFVDCPLEVVQQRDPKGLYQKAAAGEIKNMTGVGQDFESPEQPEVHLKTDEMSVEQSVEKLVAVLKEKGIVG
ncbi:adenylyl-sulfate kinase [Poriferisphaera sp. WC338]|uniref:adenylyl-sulfate kinase n=1 Tax=Poriferisphaera sp. WC338 TaxID=3425129 RepID=UPI003D81993E